jgi:hypothetical protein
MTWRTRHLPAIAGAATTLAVGAAVATASLTANPSDATGRNDRRAETAAPAVWTAADAAAIALLERIVVRAADETTPALGRCERHRPAPIRARAAVFARCALPALARLGSSGSQNATMLLRIAGDGHPPKHCGEQIRSLANGLGVLGTIARSTLRDALGGLSWREVTQASRAVRGLTAQARRLAADPIGRHACQPPDGAVIA